MIPKNHIISFHSFVDLDDTLYIYINVTGGIKFEIELSEQITQQHITELAEKFMNDFY
jgi:hypothetical protein